jgi:glycopeptide antibiotics resistance protein
MGAGRWTQWNERNRLAELGLILTTVPWIGLILRSRPPVPGQRTVYLAPFSDLWTQLTTYSGRNLVVQIGANLVVLAGFGAFGAIRWRWLAGPGRLAAAGVAVALALELLQRLLATGRVFSVDDILVNAVGCVLGGLVTRRWWARTT